jgi:ligand-binding sensor domain-containing protein
MFNIKFCRIIIIALFYAALFSSCNNNDTEIVEEKTFEKVNGFAINEKGEKLLATDNGLFIFNQSAIKFEFVESKNDLKPLNDLTYKKSSSEQLWLASNEGVLDFTGQQLYTASNSGLKNNKVTRLAFDFSGRGIFATPNGLSISDNNNWTNSTGLNNLYSNFEITDIASADNGFIYVTTNGGGVERIELDVDGVSGATIFDTDWTKLETNNINTVFIDSITQVYGTDAGVALHFSEFTKWDWEIYTTKNGLVDNNVISVVKDKANNWWFGTTKGLSRLNNSIWTNYTVESNNIISNNIRFLSVDIDGSVWFACDEGLSQFADNQWVNYSK